MDEHPPTSPSQLPPPFDWSRFAPAGDAHQPGGSLHPTALPSSPPLAPTGTPPVGPPTFGDPPPPAATPPSPRGQGGGGRRRHPAQRSRVAAAIVSGVAFAGLVGCTALAATDDPASTTGAVTGAGDASAADGTTSGSDDGYLYDRSDRSSQPEYSRPEYSQPEYSQPEYSEPDWGGSAAPGSGSSGSTGQAPATRSQGS